MADTAHKSKSAKKEFLDAPDVLREKLDKLAGWMRSSKSTIGFTGAGISTSAGIPDFRSGMDTMLKTGPGVWELRAAKKSRSAKAKTKSSLQAIPTKTHMAFVEMERRGLLHHLISQNTDGLHRRSGFNPEALSELHGNSNLEVCERCKKDYLRDFRTRTSKKVHVHYTGRKCTVARCGGKLKDSIVNFGESLPDKHWNSADRATTKADLCLAMGSSLTVTPAADLPEEVGRAKGKRLVIVNLQKTPMDRVADMVIHAKTDDVMMGLAARLGFAIPEFRLRRYMTIAAKPTRGKKLALTAQGTDVDGTPYSLFRKVSVTVDKKTSILTEEPFTVTLDPKRPMDVSVALRFRGHYAEPDLCFTHRLRPAEDSVARYVMDYNPCNGKWVQVDASGSTKDPAAMAGAVAAATGGGGGGGGGGAALEDAISKGMEALRVAESS